MMLAIEALNENYGIGVNMNDEKVYNILSDFIEDELIDLISSKLESLVK